MNRRIGIVLVLATIVCAFFLGRATREVPSVWGAGVPVSGEGPVSREGRARLSDIARAYPDAGPTGRSTPKPDTAQATAPHLTPTVPESGSGPRPLSAESEQRLRNMAERMVRLDERAGELYELAENEPAGPDSAYLEDLIATAIRRHGGGFTGLEVSRPRCTQSVCMIMATGASNSQDPRSDWQRLSLVVMNQPWFRQYFDDMTGTVTGDAKGALYLTYYIRCARGTCLYGVAAGQIATLSPIVPRAELTGR